MHVCRLPSFESLVIDQGGSRGSVFLIWETPTFQLGQGDGAAVARVA